MGIVTIETPTRAPRHLAPYESGLVGDLPGATGGAAAGGAAAGGAKEGAKASGGGGDLLGIGAIIQGIGMIGQSIAGPVTQKLKNDALQKQIAAGLYDAQIALAEAEKLRAQVELAQSQGTQQTMITLALIGASAVTALMILR